jgi:phosphomevalonate kinase
VAASVYGGLVEFAWRAGGLPAVRSLPFPSDLELLAAWTGEASSTVGLVRRYRALGNGRSELRSRFVAASAGAVRDFVTALERGGVSLASLDANAAALAELGTALGGGVVTPALARLVTIAHAHGISAKSSGAGGGDCGVALTRDHAAAERLRAAWRAAGLLPLDLRMSHTGVSHGCR